MSKSLFHLVEQSLLPDRLFLLVEIATGDRNKYEYDLELGALRLDRVLAGTIAYPFNYCDVPRTWNSFDGDPLDAIALSRFPTFAWINSLWENSWNARND